MADDDAASVGDALPTVPFTPRPLPNHLQQLIDLLPLDVPVRQSEVFEKYRRKPEYARRIRKIVSEYGWDIERKRGKAGANDDYYIRRSDGPVRPPRIRYEVPPKRRRVIYENQDWKCQMCGADVGEGQRLTLAVCDHKIPAERGGPSTDDNLQTLCTRCNLKKRQACGLCRLPSCLDCPYAFPEKFASTVVVALTAEQAKKLNHLAASTGLPHAVLLTRLLDRL